MADKQQIETEIIERLERADLFVNISIKGNLDIERNSLTIEYKKKPSVPLRRFENEISELEKKLGMLIEANCPCIQKESSYNPITKTYQLIFTRIPLEGTPDNLTYRTLIFLKGGINDYLFQKGKK